ncbi:MAG: SpoIIE family protein phosphatase [Capsulimonadales bacterium]|nr:SpoIIE family protein phosphatase [Capsulimonadales bacterium]
MSGDEMPVAVDEPTRLRILIVDDDEEDFRFARSLLRRIEDFSFEVEWVAQGEEALTRLVEQPYDICLLDYRLRRMTGLDLLKRVRERGITLPIVLLTGQEDRTVDREALRQGASDYLVKGQLDPTALERSIRYAIAQNRAEEELRSQYAFISAVLNTAEALVLVLDGTGRIVRFNRACEIKTGRPAAEAIGQPFLAVFPPAPDLLDFQRLFDEGLPPDRFPHRREWQILTPEGDGRQIVWAYAAIHEKTGPVEFLVGVGIDVTEQRMAEEALADARAREIEVGASIQRTLLVREPPEDLAGIAFGVFAMPSLRIGGDYADVFVHDEHRIDVLVGDVMGKGVPAALLGAAVKSQFQRAVRQLGFAMHRHGRLPEPEEIVTTVHYRMTPELRRLNSFITLGYARFDLESQRLTFVDCGSPPPLLWRASTGTVIALQGDNMPLGMRNEEVYRQVTTRIEPGDLIVFYSDGVTEAADETGDELFGIERLQATVAEHTNLHPQTLVERIVESVRAFSGGDSDAFSDDLTCLAVRFIGLPTDIPTFLCGREFPGHPDQAEAVRRWLREIVATQMAYFTEYECTLMEVGLSEAFNNIVLHAYRGATDRSVQIEIASYTNGIRISLLDWGEQRFQPESVVRPDIENLPTHGYGLFLLHESFDWIQYDRDHVGRNRLNLCKWHTGPTPD